MVMIEKLSILLWVAIYITAAIFLLPLAIICCVLHTAHCILPTAYCLLKNCLLSSSNWGSSES